MIERAKIEWGGEKERLRAHAASDQSPLSIAAAVLCHIHTQTRMSHRIFLTFVTSHTLVDKIYKIM